MKVMHRIGSALAIGGKARLRKLCSATLTLTAAAVMVWLALVWFGDQREVDRRHEAVAVARAQVLDLTTLDSATVDDKLASMTARLSGEFKRQFDGFAQTFADIVEKDRIQATGEVKSVAVDHFDGESASVIVASSAEVMTGKVKNVSQKDYRMRVELDREGDAWLITGMEFVG